MGLQRHWIWLPNYEPHSPVWRYLRIFLPLAVIIITILIFSRDEPESELERVLMENELVVLTRNAASSYYEGPHGPMGLEYDLARGFAEELGVELRMEVTSNVGEVLSRLAEGEADFAAAGLTITKPRQLWA
ncbi:MAG: transporter substrate-binding domain-containing protein, partial [Chromatiales bacterium]|nr:transporter substrate-binding domain-containing protein [Chromatiales bacterium]